MADNNHVNRIGIITGSSSGIGFETALTLAKNGFYIFPKYAILRKLQQSKKSPTSRRLY
jgi:NADP-dependent 3-hydroxy acid dehydrogenase YdfG